MISATENTKMSEKTKMLSRSLPTTSSAAWSNEQLQLPDNSWSLGTRNILMTVNEFAGETRVHIRQYFSPDNKKLVPTKKGIAMSMAEWQALKEHLQDVDSVLEWRGNNNPAHIIL